jgi:hypothetical protein
MYAGTGARADRQSHAQEDERTHTHTNTHTGMRRSYHDTKTTAMTKRPRKTRPRTDSIRDHEEDTCQDHA